METLFVGQNCIELKSVDSTNSFLINYCSSNTVMEGTIVVAHEQTQGRGQRGNTWLSEAKKSLCMSIVLFPKVSIKHQFSLNKCVSLALCDALNDLNIHSQIKWPNDIFVENKKIAGILIENSIRGQILSQSVIGIGVNVNNLLKSLPKAVSIKQLLKKNMELNVLITLICKYIEYYYLYFKKSPEEINRWYQQNLLGLDQILCFEKEGVEFFATLKGVDEYGRLLLDIEEQTHHFSVGELSFKI